MPGPAAGVGFILAIALLYFHVGSALQATLGERGLLLSQVLLLALPAVLFARLRSRSAGEALGLRRPPAQALAGALLIALGGIPAGWLIGWLQLPFFPEAERALRGLEALLRVDDAGRALWLLVLVALTPAVCEELVFRGVLLRSLGRELPAARAVLLTALVFGLFHLSLETALRFLPTVWVGLLMGYVAWRTGSVFASMLMHFVNNGAVVLLLWLPTVRGWVLAEDRPAWAALAAAPVLMGLGVWLLRRATPDPRSQSQPE